MMCESGAVNHFIGNELKVVTRKTNKLLRHPAQLLQAWPYAK
jgi:hypothetical protein